LGINRLGNSDFYERALKVRTGRILLCTDGFYECMNNESDVFIEILRLPDLKTVKKRIHKTIAGKNRDDATYILIDFHE
jgi:serine/threonine protein phosphatase PrpC